VARTKLSDPNVARANVVISEGEAVLTNLGAAADALYVQELDGGIGRLLRVPYGSTTPGKTEQLPLPFEGWICKARSQCHQGCVSRASYNTGRPNFSSNMFLRTFDLQCGEVKDVAKSF